jgi:hypothetical protein
MHFGVLSVAHKLLNFYSETHAQRKYGRKIYTFKFVTDHAYMLFRTILIVRISMNATCGDGDGDRKTSTCCSKESGTLEIHATIARK